jgi:hypothetical protein
MLEFLRSGASDRKLRLFAVACSRRIWQYLKENRSRHIVEIADLFADGLATEVELHSAFDEAAVAQEAVHWEGGDAVDQSAAETVLGLREELQLAQVLDGATETVGEVVAGEAWEEIYQTPGKHWSTQEREDKEAFDSGQAAEMAAQAALVREVFGNPFRPVAINPAWLRWNDGTLSKRAQAIYDNRCFTDVLMLADVLEEAGCTNSDILDHCRGSGPHARGCWVVDLILGKS